MCTKTDLIRFPHLHTIKLCSGPLRRMTTKWKTYERIYIALTNKSRKLISLEQSVSCLLVVEACLLLFWLLAASGRFRLDPETSGFRSVVRTHCFKDMTGKFKLHFLCLKKTDNVLIEEEHSLFWWETAGVLPISHWIYIISEIAAGCNVLSFSFLFFLHEFKKKIGSRLAGSFVHSLPRKMTLWQKFWTGKKHGLYADKTSQDIQRLADQRDRWSGKCEMWLCSSKAHVCISSFKKKINKWWKLCCTDGFFILFKSDHKFQWIHPKV